MPSRPTIDVEMQPTVNPIDTQPQTNVHPTALVDPRAELGNDVTIGPYSIVGPDVRIGDRCRLHHQVTLSGHTTVGKNCEFFPGVVIGLKPQDLKYRGEVTRVEIGHHNVFREMVTLHPGTAGGGGVTRIGDRNHLLIGHNRNVARRRLRPRRARRETCKGAKKVPRG